MCRLFSFISFLMCSVALSTENTDRMPKESISKTADNQDQVSFHARTNETEKEAVYLFRHAGVLHVDDSLYVPSIDLNPDLAVAYNNPGSAYWAKGQVDAAISDFTKAIEKVSAFDGTDTTTDILFSPTDGLVSWAVESW